MNRPDAGRRPAGRRPYGIVGAGIVGLAHAWEAAKRGYEVVVFERNPRPLGASIRNFGMILPLGMAPGIMHERALRSRMMWQELAEEAGFWFSAYGAMMPAYREDERRAMQEFIEWGPANGYAVSWLNGKEATRKAPIHTEGLLGALWSPIEALVDPREVLRVLPAYLAERYDVRFEFDAAVTGISMPHLEAAGRKWEVERVIVCCGSDIETLYPEILGVQDAKKCKLQMMRTLPQSAGWSLGPFLATGLSLTHYASFADMPSVADVRARVETETPDITKWGIHLLVAQHEDGSLTIGDSHEYGSKVDPFDRSEIDTLILGQMKGLLHPPTLDMAARWHGVYLKTESGEPLVLDPEPGVQIITGLGGGGMSTSFALAQDVLE